MGASLAFDAALERYRRDNYILLNYHVHIPLPDPMTNPSTLARQAFYGVRGTPSWYADGESDGGGGSAENAKGIFDRKVDPVIEKHLDVAPEAKIALRASQAGSTVKVKATVSKLASKSDKLKLHLVLVEDAVRYSGENGMRFHEMVVRGVAAPPPPAAKPAPAQAAAGSQAAAPAGTGPASETQAARQTPQGFALKPGKGGTVEYTFDLAKIAAEGRAHLEDYEKNTRKGEYTFREKKHDVNGALAVVAFVQDEATKKILQAVYVKPSAPKTTN